MKYIVPKVLRLGGGQAGAVLTPEFMSVTIVLCCQPESFLL